MMQVEASLQVDAAPASVSVSPSSVEDEDSSSSPPVDLFICVPDTPPIAPPRLNRGKVSLSLTVDRDEDDTLLQSSKQCARQRAPARLLTPTLKTTGTTCIGDVTPRGSFIGNVTPVNQLTAPSSFWTQNRYPSSSEFDTTRLNVYLHNNYTKRSSFYSRSTGSRVVPVNRAHVRSKSVDRTYKLFKSPVTSTAYQGGQNIFYTNNNNINNINNNNNNYSGNSSSNGNNSNSYTEHVESTANNLNRIVSSIRAVALNAAHRALILTRSESLQSDCTDSTSNSGDNDNEINCRVHDVPKSALKKSPVAGLNSQLTSSKNVTFSAYTTIQVMEK